MTRLPVDHGDNNTWGAVLNAFLAVGHNADGSNKNTGQVVHVERDYGALGNNTGDQSTIINQAISDLSTAGGGILQTPNKYRCLGTITPKQNVSLVGLHRGQSQLLFPTDLGAGTFAIDKHPSGIQQVAPSFFNLGIQGAGGHSLGVLGTQMNGVRLGPNANMTDCYVAGFRSGVVFNDNHNTLTRCKISNNYYNVEFPDVFTSKGNQAFINVELDGPFFASVAIFGGNIMDGCQFIGGHVGFGPYAFYKADGAAPTTLGMMSETELFGLAFEALGNAAFLDEGTGGGSGSDSWTGVVIHNPGFGWLTGTYKIAARAADYAVDLRNVNSSQIYSGTYPFSDGAVGTYRFSVGSDLAIREHVGVTPPKFSGSLGNVIYEQGTWRGIITIAASTITVGDLLGWAASQVQRYGTDNRVFAGVAMNSAAAGASVAVAQSGQVTVLNGADAIATGGVPVTPNPAGLTKIAAATSTGSFGYQYGVADTMPNQHPIIGFSDTAIGANGYGGIWLQVREDRGFVAPGARSSLPAASATYRGQLLRVEGGAGVADELYICDKNSAGTYTWRRLGVRSGVASVQNGSTIAHGLGVTPTRVMLTPSVAKRLASATALDATNITISLHDDTGAAIVVNENVYWSAEV